MKKVIIINNAKDLKRFYHDLFRYRIIFYKYTTFIYNGNNEDVKDIIKALNIKNKKARIEFVYDNACNKIDKYNEGKNICGFINNKCYTQRNTDKFNGCCRKCPLGSIKGCPTKNLTCKLFYCGEVRKRFKVLGVEDLKILLVLSYSQRLILKDDYFATKEQVLKDISYNSLFIATWRIMKRMIKIVAIK